MTGKKRRWLNPTSGLLKLAERAVDRVASRYIYPHVKGIWTPYSWQLPRRFALAETNLCPQRWPNNLPPLRVLLLSDIHTGPFLKPEVLSTIVTDLMALRPDLVVIAGDIVTGYPSELDNFLAGLAVLSEAPLGAWFCLGNHDHFSGDPEGVQERLEPLLQGSDATDLLQPSAAPLPRATGDGHARGGALPTLGQGHPPARPRLARSARC